MNKELTGKILIVDDEEVNRRVMEGLLLPRGFQLTFAANGKEALARVAADPPDVILLDIMMPVMNGYEVARALKSDAAHRRIPIVMVTALKDVGDRVTALEAGADDFLSKPVEATELYARVRSLLKVKAYNDSLVDYQKKLEEAVKKRTDQLHNALKQLRHASLETILRLSLAGEFKDDDTGAHVIRMSHYAEIVARKMGFAEDKTRVILHAAPMHDVGKIGIPDHILLKPGKLDAAEWAVMQQHTEIGRKILSGSEAPVIKLAEVCAYSHHEKWDGSGYPQGLKGAAIPVIGRIVAIADVFDALTSERPYKPPFTVEKSLEIIREGKENHFDPQVVDAFFSAMPEILATKDKYHEATESLQLTLDESDRESDRDSDREEDLDSREEYVSWRPEYSVGVDLIDEQHRVILQILNQLYTGRQKGDHDLEAILDKLEEYARTHFATEEKYMAMKGYQNLDQHRQEHDRMRRDTAGFMARARQSPSDLSQELLIYLKDWWLTHILVSDQEYVPCLTGSGTC